MSTVNYNVKRADCNSLVGLLLIHLSSIRTSVDKMLEDIDWVRLAYRWEHHLLIQAFKSTYISSLFTFTHSVHSKCTHSQSHNLVISNWKQILARRHFTTELLNYGTSFLLISM